MFSKTSKKYFLFAALLFVFFFFAGVFALTQHFFVHYFWSLKLPTSVQDQNLEPVSPHPPLYLVAGGDIMLSRYIGYLGKRDGYDRIFSGNYHPLSAFEKCEGSWCLLYFNLESLFNAKDNDIPKWGFNFRANTGNVKTLLQLRQDHHLLLSLANNHTVNTHYSGLVLTREVLDQQGISHIGAGLDPVEARDFFVYDYDTIRLCVWAYSYDGKFVKVWAAKMAWNPLAEGEILEDLQKMQNADCDVKILWLHRGAEYRIAPNKGQRALAHRLIDGGADLILWGHSHIPWEIELYQGKYIFYSLGNFIFDQSWWKRAVETNYDYIYDHDLQRRAVATYISLLAGLAFEKVATWVVVHLDEIVMTRTSDGIHYPLDADTYYEIMGKIQK